MNYPKFIMDRMIEEVKDVESIEEIVEPLTVVINVQSFVEKAKRKPGRPKKGETDGTGNQKL